MLVRRIYTVLISSPVRIPEMLVIQPTFAAPSPGGEGGGDHISNETPLKSEILNNNKTNKFM
jgi:hypothetical protein